MKKREEVDVEGRKIALSNLDKVLYPETNFTKGQVIDFYIRVSNYLLPHLQGRPITLKRYPDGVRGKFFYEKDAPRFTPEWVKIFPVPRRLGGKDIRYVVIEDLPTLVWCSNAANLELHPFLHRAPLIERPTSVVFDLDPGEGTDVLTCAEAALLLKKIVEPLGLQLFPKVSGSKGMQVYAPLNTDVTYEATQVFSRAIAQLLERDYPERIVSDMDKTRRKGKIFIDWSQNSDFKTTVGVYSLRAKQDRPWVSLPVTWRELKSALKKGSAESLYFAPDDTIRRVERLGDLFAPVLTLQQTLPGELPTGRRRRKSP